MRKSKSFRALLVLAVLFLATSVAFALTGTFASEGYVPTAYTEQRGAYDGGKVVPPGWCLEHGYFGVQDGEAYPECRYCD